MIKANPKLLFVWERSDGTIGHVMVEFPLSPAWLAQVEASNRIWEGLVKRGVIA